MSTSSRPCSLCGRSLADGEYCKCSVADPDDPLESGPALAPDGRLESRIAGIESLINPCAAPTARPHGPPELKLDSAAAEHAYTPLPRLTEPLAPAPRPRAVPVGAIGFFVLIALAAVAGYLNRDWLLKKSDALSRATRRASAKPILTVLSEPQGAEVWLGDTALGNTPYVGDFDYPDGKYLLRLTLGGYKPFTAEVEAGRDAKITARLVRGK